MKRSWYATLAALLLVGSLFATSAVAGAATKKVDRSAILIQGADVASQGGGASFDPAFIGSAIVSDAAVFYMPGIYDLMIRMDSKGGLHPGLATKWATPEPNTVVFTIRQGVKFQDGTPFTPAAVKEAWDRIRVVPASVASHDEMWNRITAIDLVGTDQVKVTLNTPVSGAFLTKIAASVTGSVPSPTAYAKQGAANFKFNPVGAGPYAFESFQPGQKVSLRKWDGYWDKKNSQKLGGIDVVQTTSGAPMVASLQAGQINLGKVSVAETPGLAGQGNITTSNFTNSTSSMLLLPCTNKAPFNNVDARAAVSTAIDRKAINQAAYNGRGEPTEVLFGKTSPYYSPEFNGKHAYNVKKAKALATKGGIQPDTSITLQVTAGSAGADRAAVVVQDNLAKIGLKTNLVVSTNFVADAKRINPELIIVATDHTSLQSFLGVGGSPNWCNYNNPTMESAIAATQANADGAPASKPAWKTIQRILSTESPELILVRAPVIWAHTKQVRGLEIAPLRSTPLIWNISMTKR